MQNKDFQIHIPKPCKADWDKMTPNEQGKFCSLCDKTVVDFTQMNKQEIKNFFIQKTEERVCGHFRASQVVVPKPRFHQFLINTYQAIESKVSFYLLRQPALFMLGGFMFLVGCESRKNATENKVEVKKDTTVSNKKIESLNIKISKTPDFTVSNNNFVTTFTIGFTTLSPIIESVDEDKPIELIREIKVDSTEFAKKDSIKEYELSNVGGAEMVLIKERKTNIFKRFINVFKKKDNAK